VNTSAINRKLGLSLGFLKTLANGCIVRQRFGDVACDCVRNLTDRRGGQTNPAEGFEILGGESIRPKTATTGSKTL
jgi:hypothetical protein